MNFRVFPLGIFIIVFYDLLALIAFGLVVFIPSSKDLWVWIISIIMFILLPVVISVYLLFYSLDLIVINDNGIEKYRFGKLKKKIAWNDVVTASVYPKSEFQSWIYISDQNISYNFLTSTFMMFDNKSICFKYNDIVILELNKHLQNKIELK